MGKKILKKILENPANLTGEKVEDHFGCDECSEQILFRWLSVMDRYRIYSNLKL